MRLAVDAVGEVEGARAAVVGAAPESQGPETARLVSRTGVDRDRAYQLMGLGIESVDFAVLEAEIAHRHALHRDVVAWLAMRCAQQAQ